MYTHKWNVFFFFWGGGIIISYGLFAWLKKSMQARTKYKHCRQNRTEAHLANCHCVHEQGTGCFCFDPRQHCHHSGYNQHYILLKLMLLLMFWYRFYMTANCHYVHEQETGCLSLFSHHHHHCHHLYRNSINT